MTHIAVEMHLDDKTRLDGKSVTTRQPARDERSPSALTLHSISVTHTIHNIRRQDRHLGPQLRIRNFCKVKAKTSKAFLFEIGVIIAWMKARLRT